MKGNCQNGEGTLVFGIGYRHNLKRYNGQFKNGLFDGLGTVSFCEEARE